jgi:hypothetical protein
MRALRILPLLIALAGASTAYADAEKATPIAELDAEKMLVFFNELVDQAVKNKDDCLALSGGVNGVIDKHVTTVEMIWALKKAKKTLPRPVQEKMDKRGAELVGALRKCLDHAAVKNAFARMKPPKDKQ